MIGHYHTNPANGSARHQRKSASNGKPPNGIAYAGE